MQGIASGLGQLQDWGSNLSGKEGDSPREDSDSREMGELSLPPIHQVVKGGVGGSVQDN